MNLTWWHLCISIFLVVIFQVISAGHTKGYNAHSDNSPMDGSSAVKEQQEHPIDGQYLAEFEYRARKRPGNRPGKRPGRPDDDYDDDNYDEENGDYKDNGDDDDNGDENTSCKKCGVILSDKGGRVVNGKTVKPLYKYPWIVPLIHDKQVVCGGALISKKFILTAGHCVFNQASLRSPKCQGSSSPKECYFKPSEFSSKLLERQRLGKPMRIKKIIPHPKFNYVKMVNDIALLELQQPVKCSGKTSPICVPTKKDIYKMGQKVYVAGWGKNMETGFRGPKKLREGVMKETNSKNCMRPGLPRQTMQQYHCLVGTNQTSCQGDSGTSNFIKYKKKYYTLGIVSHGKAPYCNPTWPVTFTKVSFFAKWIKQHVKDLAKP